MAKRGGMVRCTGATQTRDRLRDVGERGGDLRKASSAVRTIYREAQEAKFASAGHGTWPALKPETVEAKRRRGLDTRLMRASGALYKALTAPRAGAQVDERHKDSLVFGTSLPYARYHDQGSGGMPRRALMQFTAAEQKRMTETLGEFIAKGRT